MFESVLSVKYVREKTCFAYLSANHKHLNTGMFLKLSYGEDKVAYFSTHIVRDYVDIKSIGINSAYAKLLGIEENTFVNVSLVEQVSIINSISIQPYNKSDYEVLEMLAHNVQSNLLNQVRVVSSGQKLIIWIGNTISVKVFVDSVQPVSPGVLDFLTEVIIKSPNDIPLGKLNEEKSKYKSNSKYIKDFVQFLNENSPQTDSLKEKFLDRGEGVFFRLIPSSELSQSARNLNDNFPFIVYVLNSGNSKDILQNDSDVQFYTITVINNPYVAKKVYVKLCFLEDVFDESYDIFLENNSCNIFVNDSIMNFMQCEIGDRIELKKIKNSSSVKQIEIHSRKNYKANVVEKLKIYLSNNAPLILNSNFPLEIDDKIFCFLKFLPTLDEYCIVNSDFLRNCSYTLSDEEVPPLEERSKIKKNEKTLCLDLLPVKKVCNDIISVLCVNSRYRAENVVLIGKSGMGKSTILNHTANIFSRYPYFIYIEIVQCKKIKGKTSDSLHKFFTDLFNKLVFCQPSLLILDDLHILCESCEGEETPNSVYYNRVSEMVYTLFSTIPKYNSIGILATVESLSKLNKNLFRSRGNHLFKSTFIVGDLNKADRILLLKYFFEKHSVEPNLDYSEFSIKTDGFVIQDIQDFYKKVLFEAYKESNSEQEPIISNIHCDIALKKSCALSLQNVKFHSVGSKSFDDIGGLRNVKTVLIESLLWPVKYSSIYANAPLRLQSGLLLYGPPGTGKTLLAGAAAKQCNLRLISIKGPELLSKYIGASEQAVRDVFEKAQRAKPCILFFDEFDSLAPRRGHDNTGVTDRVVNQLLTQLDGVEALTGVCVLAATSRPDLLDPALLRPGRLDKQILCPMPHKDDRLDILNILSKKLDLDEAVDLEAIAIKTEGYSGADLQSVLYTAQISSIRPVETQNEATVSTSKITQMNLLDALERTRPSLTRNEKLKYDRIYAKFEGGNMEDFRAGSKVTLA